MEWRQRRWRRWWWNNDRLSNYFSLDKKQQTNNVSIFFSFVRSLLDTVEIYIKGIDGESMSRVRCENTASTATKQETEWKKEMEISKKVRKFIQFFIRSLEIPIPNPNLLINFQKIGWIDGWLFSWGEMKTVNDFRINFSWLGESNSSYCCSVSNVRMVKLKYMIYEMSIISDMWMEEFPFPELYCYIILKNECNRW